VEEVMPTFSSPAPEAVRASRLPRHALPELPWIRNAEAPPMECQDELADMAGMDAFPASDPPHIEPQS
jgi:hypothetical protein